MMHSPQLGHLVSLGLASLAFACSVEVQDGESSPQENTALPGSGSDVSMATGATTSTGGSVGAVGTGATSSGGLVETGTGGATLTGGAGTGGAGPVGVGLVGFGELEDSTTICDVGDVPSLSGGSTLPDPFLKWDGSRVASQAEWACRRQETKKEVEAHIFGPKPGKPESVTGTVSESSISIDVSHGGNSTSFSVGVSLPSSGSAPFPVLISYGGGFFGFSQSSVVQGEGVAVIEYDPYVVGSESASRGSKSGAFYDIYGSSSESGLLAAWAWGVSRILDVIESSGGELLVFNKAAVAGCSRFGKGAFAAGVFDERIALTLPFEAGSGGPAAFKSIAQESGAQSPGSAYGETYWLGDVFGAYTNDTGSLPVDMHQALGMIAPRGVLILGNPHIDHLSPNSEHLSALAGAEVWKALGAERNFSFHAAVSSGDHCAARPEHVEPIQRSVQAFLFDNGEPPGVVSPGGGTSADLSQWRDWDTPTFE